MDILARHRGRPSRAEEEKLITGYGGSGRVPRGSSGRRCFWCSSSANPIPRLVPIASARARAGVTFRGQQHDRRPDPSAFEGPGAVLGGCWCLPQWCPIAAKGARGRQLLGLAPRPRRPALRARGELSGSTNAAQGNHRNLNCSTIRWWSFPPLRRSSNPQGDRCDLSSCQEPARSRSPPCPEEARARGGASRWERFHANGRERS